MKLKIWSRSQDLRANMPLTLSRVKSGKADGTGRESYSTELECCGVSFAIAPCQNEANAEWLVKGWAKSLDKILANYELQKYVQKPKSISDPEDFVRAIVNSTEYLTNHKENE